MKSALSSSSSSSCGEESTVVKKLSNKKKKASSSSSSSSPAEFLLMLSSACGAFAFAPIYGVNIYMIMPLSSWNKKNSLEQEVTRRDRHNSNVKDAGRRRLFSFVFF
jgi:hypothetical protein